MRTAPFGPAQTEVALVGQGTWNIERDDEAQVVRTLRAGLDAGMTHIDTAELYGGGRAERIVGRAIVGRRDEIFLVSKVLPSNASYSGTIAACEASLERLGTERLDLFLLHWRGRVPLAETFRAFDKLVADGKIASFGVSNFAVGDLEEAMAITGPGRIACNQVLYHMAERSIEPELIPWCRRHGVAVVAYSPFGSGDFPRARSAGGEALARVAAECGASPYRIALAFLIAQGNAFVIPKAARLEHALDNAAAGDLVLAAAQMRTLDTAFPVKRRRGLAMI